MVSKAASSCGSVLFFTGSCFAATLVSINAKCVWDCTMIWLLATPGANKGLDSLALRRGAPAEMRWLVFFCSAFPACLSASRAQSCLICARLRFSRSCATVQNYYVINTCVSSTTIVSTRLIITLQYYIAS